MERTQALLDLDYARELIEIATDHRVLAGTPDSSYMSNDEEIFYGPDGHSKCLEDARMIIADVRGRRYIPSDDVYDPRN